MEKLVATIPKNAREDIRVSLDEYKGHDLLTLWVWTKGDSVTEPCPTKKGVAFQVDLLPDVLQALKEAKQFASSDKLL